MKNKIPLSVKTVLLVIIVCLLWFTLTKQTAVYLNYDTKVEHVQNFITQQQAGLKQDISLFKDLYLSKNNDNEDLTEELVDRLTNNDVTVCVYKHDSLVYWSSNSNISEYNKLSEAPQSKFFCHDKSWYLSEHIHMDSLYFTANLKVKQEFEYQNHLLKNNFHPGLKLNPNSILSKDIKVKPNIYGNINEYLFSIEIPESTTLPNSLQNILFALFVLTILTSMYIIWSFINRLKINFGIKLSLILLLVTVFRALSLMYEWPRIIYQSQIFDPSIYAYSSITPSLGDLFINVIITLVLLLFVYAKVQFAKNKIKRNWKGVLAIFVFLVSVYLLHFLFKTLIINSTRDFLMYDFVQMNSVTLVGFVTMIFFLGCFSVISRIVASQLICNFNVRQLFIVLSIPLVVVISFFAYKQNWLFMIEIALTVFYFVTLLILANKQIIRGFRFNLLLISLLSLIGIFHIVTNQYTKQVNDSELIASNLSNERDAVLETLVPKLIIDVKADTLMPYYLMDLSNNTQKIYNHITTEYLNGYINKYDIQITGCYDETNLVLDQTNNSVGCYVFFDKIINESCIEVTHLNFYYNNNHNGRVSYLGVIKYPINGTQDSASIYIELESKLANRYLGYPELLIESPRTNIAQLKGFSYANYNNQSLVSANGDYDFPKTIALNNTQVNEIKRHKLNNGNLEYWYNINDNNVILIIKPFILGYKVLYLLSHLFIGLYILFLLMYYKSSGLNILEFFNSLHGKIKISIIGVLIISLILISFGTLKYTIGNYQKYHLQNINEKVKSIMVELENKINTSDNEIIDSKDYLNFWLIRFSNVFYTDINLYSTSGDLIATSREEIFVKDLACRKINRKAKEVLDKGVSVYSCVEKIGKLEYSSVYVPFLNSKNKAIAYLNIPYFTRQNELQSQLYQLINVGVNIFIILALLAVSIAILISNRISKPLRMLQTGLSELSIGGNNKILTYNKKDEISLLVVAYNNKVSELQKSIEKLAEQEREDAWKKMSRQIAHEIKNPLTPMKLRVQFLERSLLENPENIKEELAKFVKTMIQQIDSLAYIANQFANFSKLSEHKPVVVNPIDVINDVLSLYSKTKNIKFSTTFNETSNVVVDKELLPRVFINIIKNAIHSIPDSRDGEIEIGIINKQDDYLEFYVKDNGKGIDTENQSRLFEPNFTTKTSGMGLGLSIVKNIIENSGGKIWFETVKDEGTCFYFTLPVAKDL